MLVWRKMENVQAGGCNSIASFHAGMWTVLQGITETLALLAIPEGPGHPGTGKTSPRGVPPTTRGDGETLRHPTGRKGAAVRTNTEGHPLEPQGTGIDGLLRGTETTAGSMIGPDVSGSIGPQSLPHDTATGVSGMTLQGRANVGASGLRCRGEGCTCVQNLKHFRSKPFMQR